MAGGGITPPMAVSSPKPTAAVVVSGSELLSGLHHDTNTGFLERRLARLGIATRFTATVGDRPAEMVPVFRYALDNHPILLVSGGLGPTVDDLTREALAEATGLALAHSDQALAEIQARFQSMGRTMSENNRRQAMVPQSGRYFSNPNGTAPGLLFDIGDRIAIALPGPPRELQPMVENHLVPLLLERFPGLEEASRVRVRLVGIGESNVDQLIREKIVLDPDIEISLLARLGLVDVTLSVASSQPADIARITAFRDRIARHLHPYCYSLQIDEPLEAAVGALLRTRGETIGTAESCTGGLIATSLTAISGSSDYVKGALVTYSNQAKIELLGVRPATLERHGAVSEAVVMEMAEGALEKLGCTWSIAVSGVAGPTGGTEDKPVGTVWIAIGHAGQAPQAERFRFPGDRESVRERSRVTALGKLRRAIENASH